MLEPDVWFGQSAFNDLTGNDGAQMAFKKQSKGRDNGRDYCEEAWEGTIWRVSKNQRHRLNNPQGWNATHPVGATYHVTTTNCAENTEVGSVKCGWPW